MEQLEQRININTETKTERRELTAKVMKSLLKRASQLNKGPIIQVSGFKSWIDCITYNIDFDSFILWYNDKRSDSTFVLFEKEIKLMPVEEKEMVKYIGCSDNQLRWGTNSDPRGVLKKGETYVIECRKLSTTHTKYYLKGYEQ